MSRCKQIPLRVNQCKKIYCADLEQKHELKTELEAARSKRKTWDADAWQAKVDAVCKRKKYKFNSHGEQNRMRPEDSGSDTCEIAAETTQISVCSTGEEVQSGHTKRELSQMLGHVFLLATHWPLFMLREGLARSDSACAVLQHVGVGGRSRDSFMRMLARRYLQMIGLSVGELPVFGSGSWWAVQHLLGHDVETRPPIAEGVAVCLALLPVCAWVVEKYLGVSWVGLLCFMTVQHLCCEYRRWHDNTKQRRPESPKRADSLRELIAAMAFDFGLNLIHDFARTHIFAKRPRPDLPSTADSVFAESLLDFFEALVIRWAALLGHKKVQTLTRGVADIVQAERWDSTRTGQWAWQLDRGSLVTWKLVLRGFGANIDRSIPGWARDYDQSWHGLMRATASTPKPFCWPDDRPNRVQHLMSRLENELQGEPGSAALQVLRHEVGNPRPDVQQSLPHFLLNLAASVSLLAEGVGHLAVGYIAAEDSDAIFALTEHTKGPHHCSCRST